MTVKYETEPLLVGTYVKIRNSDYGRAQVVEYRGLLGPGGSRVYRVCVRKKPSPAFTEVREDQLEVLPAKKRDGREDSPERLEPPLAASAPPSNEALRRILATPVKYETEPLQIGTYVKIRNSHYGRAQIVEYRGLLGPGGSRVYRVCVRKKPSPAFTEVREDQLEILLAKE